MSGICGVINYDLESDTFTEVLTKMTESLVHRGPDGMAVYTNEDVGLGVRIHNIFHKPVYDKIITNEEQTIFLVPDCEIYNYKELKKDLQDKGHHFNSDTDAEVIVHLYEELGEKCVDNLRGVFAFAIWDEIQKKLLLCRDRLGSRPVYYSEIGNSFLFGSEIKAILEYGSNQKKLNYNALDYFLTYRLIPEPMTIFEDIQKLPAGCYLTLQDNNIDVKRYWDYNYIEDEDYSIEEYEEQLIELLQDSINIRLFGDLAYGSYLSGGMDSSSVVSLLSNMINQPLKTFSIAFNEKGYDESYYQRIVAKYCGTDHHEFVVEKESVEELLPKIISFFDEPFGDSSALPSYYLAKVTKEHVSCVMTGDGGDELLAGYTTYPGMLYSESYRSLPGIISKGIVPGMLTLAGTFLPKKYAYNVERYKKVINDANLPFEERYKQKISWARAEEKERLYNDETKNNITTNNAHLIDEFFEKTVDKQLLNRVNYTDVRFRFVNTVLAKTERTCIANSLIARSPYLDHKLIEFAASVPPSLKVKGFKTKYLLHRAMGDKLPQEVHKKQKHGFEPPLAIWFKDELEPFVKTMLLSPDSRVLNYFKKEGIEETIGIHSEGRKNLGEHLWGLLNFELWHRKYMD